MDKDKEEKKTQQDHENDKKPQQFSGYIPDWYIQGAYNVAVVVAVAV